MLSCACSAGTSTLWYSIGSWKQKRAVVLNPSKHPSRLTHCPMQVPTVPNFRLTHSSVRGFFDSQKADVVCFQARHHHVML